jgi:hypothetical protein
VQAALFAFLPIHGFSANQETEMDQELRIKMTNPDILTNLEEPPVDS